jgi:hypothetical protein
LGSDNWSRRLGPRTRFGAFGGISSNQAIVAAIGATITLTVLSETSPSPLALPAAIVVGGAFAAITTVRYKGMPIANWTLKALAYATGKKSWAARAIGEDAEQLPRELGDVRIVAVRDRTSLVGMLKENKTLTAVARIELHSLGLFDPDEQGRRLDSFRRILDDLARENDDRYRVVMLARHVPRRANAEVVYVKTHAKEVDSPQVKSMLSVIEDTQTATHDYEFFVCLRQSVRHEDQTAVRLIERLRTLVDRLEQSDVAIKTTRSLLEPRELARLIKDSFDPFERHLRDELEATLDLPGTDPTAAWPDATRRNVTYYEADAALHATLWMRHPPAVSVTPGWLRPLTLHCAVPAMTVATVMKPDERSRALTRIRRKKTRGAAARIFRHRHGQVDTAEHSSQEEFVERQEYELAFEGATPWHWEMYVTVSAPSREELDKAVRKAESACVDCGLTPVLLRWAQAEAFTFTLPLGRGLEPEKARL